MHSQICDLRNTIIENEFNKMNPMQLEAVLSIDGPLLILAGAGSGKTTVLVNRIANILKFGHAYGSTEIETMIDSDSLELLKSYSEGNSILFSHIKSLLSVNAPKPLVRYPEDGIIGAHLE